MNPRALAAVVVELRKERDASAANEAAAAAAAAAAADARPFNARPFTRPGGGAGPPGEPS